jgi:preprotein translocase subunit YajC
MSILGLKLLLADAAPVARNQTGDQIKAFGTMAIIMVILYMVMIAPQRKKQKELDNTLKSLKPGDKILTSSGIVGVVLSIKDKTITIRSADTKLEVIKSSIAEITDRTGDTSTESKS